MNGRLGKLTDALAANLWLIPLLAFVLAFALSRGLLAFDQTLDVSTKAWFLYGGSPQGARQLLATIAGSMITFIGLVFSSTILVLQLASSQFSPRVMRSFFRDRIIQTALGTFIATFAFAIFVLRELRESAAAPFVPGLSTYVAISLVWLSLAMFVVYINHIAERIRAVTVIGVAARETATTLARSQRNRPPLAAFVPPSQEPEIVRARRHGSVAGIDAGALVRFGAVIDARFEVIPLAGDFVRTGSPVVRAWCSRALSPGEIERAGRAISIERERSMRADPLFGFRQLVDIANKALSPGINDPTTAVLVLDQLAELLRAVAADEPRSDVYPDDRGVVRVFVPRPTWSAFVDASLEEILHYGRGSLHVMRKVRTLVVDLEEAVAPGYRPVLERYRLRVETSIDDAFTRPEDRAAARRLPPATGRDGSRAAANVQR
ncbi:MAG: DUF2254 domain-containing protein [Candidatus Eremiobacteraeota bacterium]|nr:DUF2254 domain-containing protein [Candidatus Eremiobacteraeota bacterium]